MNKFKLEPRNGVIKNKDLSVPILDIPIEDGVGKFDNNLSKAGEDYPKTYDSYIGWRTVRFGSIIGEDIKKTVMKRFH